MKTNRLFNFSSCCFAAALCFTNLNSPVRADAVVTSAQESSLAAALQAGGHVTFSFDGTILLTTPITISNNAILDGTNHSITISGGGAMQLFNLPAGYSLALWNLTLANGLERGAHTGYFGLYPGPAYGGAISSAGDLDVENCVLTNNSVICPGITGYDGKSTFGGAIYNTGTLTISNALFVNNSAIGGSGAAEHVSASGSGYGGALCSGGGMVCLGNVVFSNNAAVGGIGISVIYGGEAGQAYGGAISASQGVINANNIQVIHNSATGGNANQFAGYFGPVNGGSAYGGALYLTGSTVAISNSVFSNNSTTGTSADGGHPDNRTADASITLGLFSSQRAVSMETQPKAPPARITTIKVHRHPPGLEEPSTTPAICKFKAEACPITAPPEARSWRHDTA